MCVRPRTSVVAVVVSMLPFALPLLFEQACSAQQQRQLLFQRLDRNRDGKLTRDEFPERFRDRFANFDSDRDGAVTLEEFTRFTRRPQPERKVIRTEPTPPPNVRIERDIPYADTDNPRQKLDLYLPAKPATNSPLPVVVWIHGGAWRAGHKRSGFGRLVPLVSRGYYAGVSVAYRLSNEAKWPAQIHDCKAAIRWIRANASKYNLDPDKIGVWGSSAGGHLVAMLGTSGDVKELEGTLGKYTDQSSRVQCVVDFYGPSNLLTIGNYPSQLRHNAPDSPESLLIGGPILENTDKARSASPVTYVSEDDPPFLIVHGDSDPVVPYQQSVELHNALQKAGVTSYLITVKGAGHGFRNPEVVRRVELFFDRFLRGADVEIPVTPIVESRPAKQAR